MCVDLEEFLFCFALFVLVIWHRDAIAGMKSPGHKMKMLSRWCYFFFLVLFKKLLIDSVF